LQRKQGLEPLDCDEDCPRLATARDDELVHVATGEPVDLSGQSAGCRLDREQFIESNS
jgi:hypothetical protein